MTDTEHVIAEAPQLAALGSPEVASGNLPIGLKALVDAGVHFGHQTRRWNPKMRPYIYGARNGIHIIDLDQTAELFRRAFHFVTDQVARGGSILFVGTKRQASEVIQEEAERAGQYFVAGRWLGGTLTNFRTIKQGITRLRDLDAQVEDGSIDMLRKREALSLHRERERLEKYLGGIKMMTKLPSAIFVIDPAQEHIAVSEGRKLHIPIVALTDSNCDPGLIDFIIPGNDDALRSIKLITSRIADACLEGANKHREFLQSDQSLNTGARGSATGSKVEVTTRRRGNETADANTEPKAAATAGVSKAEKTEKTEKVEVAEKTEKVEAAEKVEQDSNESGE